MKKIPTILLVISVITLFNCSRNDKYFTGKYETFYVSHHIVPNGINMFTGRTYNTGMDIYMLNKIAIEIFIDESTKMLSGNGHFVFNYVNNGKATPTLDRRRIDLQLSDYHIIGDTIFFKLSSKIYDNKLDGYFVKSGDKNIFGIDRAIGGINDYTTKNPFYVSLDRNYIVTNVVTPQSLTEGYRSFFENEIKDNENKINSLATVEVQKKALSNANSYIKKNHM